MTTLKIIFENGEIHVFPNIDTVMLTSRLSDLINKIKQGEKFTFKVTIK